jgi:eukaryotic-like serine/threonine-protein kinase
VPIGTGAYISPEQLLYNRSDPRSDLFALGVLKYFFATGQRPFGDPAKVAGWRRRLYRDPIAPRTIRDDIPPWLQELILRCLDGNAKARHATAGQLAFDLQHPDAIVLTERADRRVTRPAADNGDPLRPCGSGAPAVRADLFASARPGADRDGSGGSEQRLGAPGGALRLTVRRTLQTEQSARLACVNVLKLARVALDEFEDAHFRMNSRSSRRNRSCPHCAGKGGH